MKAADFRQMGEKDLGAKIESLEENLFRLNCNKTLGYFRYKKDSSRYCPSKNCAKRKDSNK